MIRKIIQINEDLCNGCGLCVNACHESAIGLVDGKARLLRDDYCDGLGNCLPACPMNAITFVEREALAYNEEEVKRNIESKKLGEMDGKSQETHTQPSGHPIHSGCPGSRMMSLQREKVQGSSQTEQEIKTVPSMLRQWPVQIQLVPPNAPYFKDADLLIAADCTAYSFGDFHQFMRNKITLIGCPKLDDADYAVKFKQILSMNRVKSITIIRMEVPCCGGIVHAVKQAMLESGQIIPWRVITLSTGGEILEDEE